jgi:hypothetical protein
LNSSSRSPPLRAIRKAFSLIRGREYLKRIIKGTVALLTTRSNVPEYLEINSGLSTRSF